MLSQLLQKLPCLPFLFVVLAVLLVLTSFESDVERLNADNQKNRPQDDMMVEQTSAQVSFKQ